MGNEHTRVLVITSDTVKRTGKFFHRFKAECGISTATMPKGYGFVWQSIFGLCFEIRLEDDFVSGGGFNELSPFKEEKLRYEWERDAFESIRDCVLLMDLPTFARWNVLCQKHNFKYDHLHCVNELSTS